MPFFKTGKDILFGGEFFDENWMDSNKLVLPPKVDWDYSRPLKFEDVDIWEVIAEPWDIGVYAAWNPYAEFYVVVNGRYNGWQNPHLDIEEYYGPGAQIKIQKRLKELNILVALNDYWVDEKDMWLYE